METSIAKKIQEEEIVQREIQGRPSTERTGRMREMVLNAPHAMDPLRSYYFTEGYKKAEADLPMMRHANALRDVFEKLGPIIRSDEQIAGALTRYIKGAVPFVEWECGWMIKEMAGEYDNDGPVADDILGQRKSKDGMFYFGGQLQNENDKEMLEEILVYWKGRSMDQILPQYLERFMGKGKYDKLRLAQQSALLTPTLQAGVVGRSVLDYEKLLKKGFKGIIEEVKEAKENLVDGVVVTGEDFDKALFYEALQLELEGIVIWTKGYAKEAEKMSLEEAGPERKEELREMADICQWVSENPPRNFREALQCFWFGWLALCIDSMAMGAGIGRFDQWMFSFYQADIKAGRLTREEALELVEELIVKFNDIQCLYPTSIVPGLGGTDRFIHNLMLGGCTADGKDAGNELSIIVMDAMINIAMVEPSIGVRIHNGMSDKFLMKAAELVKSGLGQPAFFNDNAGIQHWLAEKGASLEDARNWCIGGCVGMTLSGKCPPTVVLSYENVAKEFELALNNGVDPLTGAQVGVETGDPEGMTYDELAEAFERQRSYTLKLSTEHTNIHVDLINRVLPCLYRSSLIDDCIEKGKSCLDGGARYSEGHGEAMICGTINVANSLAAIKKCVFEDNSFTMKELREALKTNFEGNGYGEIQKKLLAAPKWGNNDDYVDSIAVALYKNCWDHLRVGCPAYDGSTWSAAPFSVSAHPMLGRFTGATPDGRKACEYLCDGSISAYTGTDVSGVTALMLSGTKIDPVPFESHQLNVKFHPSALKGAQGSRSLLALIKTFFDKGAYHVQFNVVDSKMLKDAQKHPENYKDLVVRIAGFSVYWAELSERHQNEVISRIEYGQTT